MYLLPVDYSCSSSFFLSLSVSSLLLVSSLDYAQVQKKFFFVTFKFKKKTSNPIYSCCLLVVHIFVYVCVYMYEKEIMRDVTYSGEWWKLTIQKIKQLKKKNRILFFDRCCNGAAFIDLFCSIEDRYMYIYLITEKH